MTAIILAGGKGTRLEPFTISIPKPLMPIGEVPILEVVIRQLTHAGVSRIILSLGHMAYFFDAFVARWRSEGINVECVSEQHPLGTAGSIRLVDGLDDNFLVMNGDILTTLDYRALIQQHVEADAWGTIAVSRRELKVDFGVVHMSSEHALDRYDEKPILRYDVSMGINVLSRRCIEMIPTGRKYDIPDLMQSMRDAGHLVLCHSTTCYWQDIGRFDDLQRANADFAADPNRFMPSRTI